MNIESILYFLAQYSGGENFSEIMGVGMVGFGFDIRYWILIGAITVVSMVVQGKLKARFRFHSQYPTRLSGAEAAELMLRQNGIRDVSVISVGGQLTDHYNPLKKTVNLSEVVYSQRNAAAVAVAAHECGHALQHARGYAALRARSALVPMAQFGSGFAPILIMVGLVLMGMKVAIGFWVGVVGVCFFAAASLFALVTLPVEFDASHRALVWMKQSRIVDSEGQDRAKNALFWAAMTYVVGALAALAQLAYWAMLVLGRRD